MGWDGWTDTVGRGRNPHSLVPVTGPVEEVSFPFPQLNGTVWIFGFEMNTVPTCNGDGAAACTCAVTQTAMLGLPQIVDADGNCKTCHHTFGTHPVGTAAPLAPGKSRPRSSLWPLFSLPIHLLF